MNEQLKKGEKPLIEGKTKVIWPVVGDEHVAIMQAKTKITADNDPDKTQDIASKAISSTKTTAAVFELLQQAGLPVAYVKQLSETELLVPACTMLPFEAIIRRYAVGSFLQRYPNLKKGNGELPEWFHQLRFELFLKTTKGKLGEIDLLDCLPGDKEELITYLDGPKALKNINAKRAETDKEELSTLLDAEMDELRYEAIKLIDDPWIENPHDKVWNVKHPKKPTWVVPNLFNLEASDYVTQKRLTEMEELTRKAFLVLEGAWNVLGYRLIDYKIEFGEDKEGNLFIADVIDNDSWRLRTPDWKELSKQLFRDGSDLADVEEAYKIVASLTDQFRIPKQTIIIWRGSPNDTLPKTFEIPGVHYELPIISGHKSPVAMTHELERLQTTYPEGGVIIPIVGMSNGLGPTISARTDWPVVSVCATSDEHPEDVWSCLRMPSAVPNATFLGFKQALLFAMNVLAAKNPAAYMLRRYDFEIRDEG